jgi:hypothetical protein
MNASDLSNAMNVIGEHTFRNGFVVAKIGGFSSDGDKFTVDSVFASYDGLIVELDCPIHLIGFEVNSDPVEFVHNIIADLIRRNT